MFRVFTKLEIRKEEFVKFRKYDPLFFIVILVFVLQFFVMTLWKDHSFVAIHDNLDLFIAHNKMMKDQAIFFSKEAVAPMLGGISRNLLGSEFYLFHLLFYFFPPYPAYVIGYFLKIFLGFGGSLLLAKEYYGKDYVKYGFILYPVAAAFSMIPVFPAYGICFTSIPLLLYLLLKIKKEGRPVYYLWLFCYPTVSYFAYFGIFILGYMSFYFLLSWGKQKRIPYRMFLCIAVLFVGYAAFEYRLFQVMLFSGESTIREEIVPVSRSFWGAVKEGISVLMDPGLHAQDSHEYFLLPCIAIILFRDLAVKRKEKRKREIMKDPAYAVLGMIFINCLIYGLYQWRPLREGVEFLIPKLKGFQWNRTIFFNPFLWYLLFFLCLKKVSDTCEIKKEGKKKAAIAAVISMLIVMGVPKPYNDFYNNCYHHGYEILKNKPSSQLSFREFYSEELFHKIKEELNYQGEWSAAYGMHPAVLQYNGIATLDGYLGIYGKEYKDKFYQLIRPALEKCEEFRLTFQNSGIRAYLFSGNGENTYLPLKDLQIRDKNLFIDMEVFEEMGGRYIFSRFAVENGKELGLQLYGIFTEKSSPYRIYVYQTKQPKDLQSRSPVHKIHD